MARALVDAQSMRVQSASHVNMMPMSSLSAQPLRRASVAPVLGDITNTGFAALNSSKPAMCIDHQKAGMLVVRAAPLVSAMTVNSFLKPGAPVLDGQCRSACSTSAPPAPISDAMDQDDDTLPAEDPQSVAEYAHDIYAQLVNSEENYQPRPDYMDSQVDINAKMRAILVDWLVEVHMKYKLKTETLFMAVNLVDRYLVQRQLTRKRLQLCGVTAMLIAAKFEEIYPPEVRDFVYITDNAYTKDDILLMEVSMLTVLGFNICCPTVAHFLERYQRLNRCTEEHFHLMQYLVELCLPELKMMRYTPSHLAAAAAVLSNKLLKQHPAWPPCMVRNSNQTESMLKACAREMCGLLEAAERSPLQAVRRKYSQPKYSGVAKLSF